MKVQRIETSSGVDDIRLIAESESDRLLIKQLAEAGSLISRTSVGASSIVYRVATAVSSVGDTNNNLVSRGRIGKLDFTIRQNQNFIVDLRFIEAGNPLDLTTYTAIKLQFKHHKEAPAVVSLAVASGLTVSGDDNNVLGIQLTPDQSKLLTRDEYYYDIVMETESSKTYYIEGKAKIERTATR